MLEIISIVALLLGIITSIVTIGTNFKIGSFTKGLLVLSLCGGFIVFSKIIFEYFYSNSQKAYVYFGFIAIVVIFFALLYLKFNKDYSWKDFKKEEDKIPLVIVSLAPFLAFILNLIAWNFPTSPTPQEYIATLSQYKISRESFVFMAQNMHTTIYFCIKVFEEATIIMLSIKSLWYIFRLRNTEIPPSIKIFSDTSVLVDFIFLIFFSTNIFLMLLENIYRWF